MHAKDHRKLFDVRFFPTAPPKNASLTKSLFGEPPNWPKMVPGPKYVDLKIPVYFWDPKLRPGVQKYVPGSKKRPWDLNIQKMRINILCKTPSKIRQTKP